MLAEVTQYRCTCGTADRVGEFIHQFDGAQVAAGIELVVPGQDIHVIDASRLVEVGHQAAGIVIQRGDDLGVGEVRQVQLQRPVQGFCQRCNKAIAQLVAAEYGVPLSADRGGLRIEAEVVIGVVVDTTGGGDQVQAGGVIEIRVEGEGAEQEKFHRVGVAVPIFRFEQLSQGIEGGGVHLLEDLCWFPQRRDGDGGAADAARQLRIQATAQQQ